MILVVDMMPPERSGEFNTDSEPNVAVNPANPSIVAATAFTPDVDADSGHSPVYVSHDGGQNWKLNSIVPLNSLMPEDITLRFSGSNHLYAAYMPTSDPGTAVAIARTADMSLSSPLEVIATFNTGDQPYVEAATIGGKDRVYVGINDGGVALVRFCLDAAAPSPTFVAAELGGPEPASHSTPQIRTAIHPSGTVYGTFYRVDKDGFDIVVVRDDDGGVGGPPYFADLKGAEGVEVVHHIQTNGSLGKEDGGGELSIAVDPRPSGAVYLAWADQQPDNVSVLHVRRSDDGGLTWGDDRLVVHSALNPALAVAADGTVGFLYQQYTGGLGVHRWVTHFQTSGDRGKTWDDAVLADTPANVPEPQNATHTYLGDYLHLMAVGHDFYGVFSAYNQPDPANFPQGAVFHRTLAKSAPPSVDAFFFKTMAKPDLAGLFDRLRNSRTIDPRAVLLPKWFVDMNRPRPPTEGMRGRTT